MILVMCANAGIDRTYEVEHFEPGGYHVPKRARADAGGKGVNVARGLQVLGEEVFLVGFGGGMSKDFISRRLAQQEIVSVLVPIGEESRMCINIIDRAAQKQTQLDETSPLVTPAEIDELERQWRRLLEKAELAIISGSAPRGVPFHLYADLIRMAKRKQVPVMLDARDQLLAQAVEAGPAVVKPNLAELEMLMGRELKVPEGVVAAGRELLEEHGARIVIVSLGESGAIFVTPREGIYRVRSPQVEWLSSVGCGDAMVAGFAFASARREPLEERMRWSVAAAATVACSFGAALETGDTVRRLLPEVTIEKLGP